MSRVTRPPSGISEQAESQLRGAATSFVESARRITGTSDLSIGAYEEMVDGLVHTIVGYLAEWEEEKR